MIHIVLKLQSIYRWKASMLSILFHISSWVKLKCDSWPPDQDHSSPSSSAWYLQPRVIANLFQISQFWEHAPGHLESGCGGATPTLWAGSISIITGRGHRTTSQPGLVLFCSHHEIFVILDVLQMVTYYYFIFTSFCGGLWTGLSTLNSLLFVIYGTLKIAAGDKAPE